MGTENMLPLPEITYNMGVELPLKPKFTSVLFLSQGLLPKTV